MSGETLEPCGQLSRHWPSPCWPLYWASAVESLMIQKPNKPWTWLESSPIPQRRGMKGQGGLGWCWDQLINIFMLCVRSLPTGWLAWKQKAGKPSGSLAWSKTAVRQIHIVSVPEPDSSIWALLVCLGTGCSSVKEHLFSVQKGQGSMTGSQAAGDVTDLCLSPLLKWNRQYGLPGATIWLGGREFYLGCVDDMPILENGNVSLD